MSLLVTSKHNAFDNSLQTVLDVEDGAVVTFECPSAFAWGPDATVDDLARLGRYPHILAGPINIKGAEPGDALVIDILDVVTTNEYGTIAFAPGFGLLSDDFSEPFLRVVHYKDGAAELAPGVRVPLDPFLGIIAVAPAEPGEHSTTPPRPVGGNLDNKHFRPGTQVVLPVAVSGAMFSCGDGHACQGDGEVCGTAVEASVRATLRFSIRKGGAPTSPQALVRRPLEQPMSEAGYAVTSGLGSDLFACAQDAIRNMISLIVADYDVSREEAYCACSMAADLRISEIVNKPTWMVSAYLPLSIFDPSLKRQIAN